jgi:hypothetical protein
MFSTTVPSLLCHQPSLRVSSKAYSSSNPIPDSEFLSIMLLQEPREDINLRLLSRSPAHPSFMSQATHSPSSMHYNTRSPVMSSSTLAPSFDLRDYPYIPSTPRSAPLPSAKWASDEHGVLPKRLVVAGRSTWSLKGSPSSTRASPSLSSPATRTTHPAKNKSSQLVVDTKLANTYRTSSGNQETHVITGSSVLPVTDDHSPGDRTDCDLASFPWQLFPQPPPLVLSTQHSRSVSASSPANLEVIIEPPVITDPPRESLSSQSDDASTDSYSSTGSFFQFPYPSRNRDDPYTYSSSDVVTVPDAYSEESNLSACDFGCMEEDIEADTDSNLEIPPDVQSRSSSSIDEPIRKRLSALLSRHRSRPSQDSITVPDIPFDEYKPPTEEQLSLAASLHVLDENGTQVRFGDLWEKQRTVVCFIRHFWFVFPTASPFSHSLF